MKIKVLTYILPFLLFAALSSCSRNDPDVIAERDEKKILAYIDEHNLDAIELEEGVWVAIDQEGSGGHPAENSVVLMNYRGFLLNDDVFDEGFNARINLQQAVRGFRIGVMAFRRGGLGTILIPSAAGYGEYPSGNIPRNSVLIFEVEIIDF